MNKNVTMLFIALTSVTIYGCAAGTYTDLLPTYV